jgi:hypothetical protein
MGTRSAWTPERRARQAELIRRVKPWKRSTGPRTAAGKAKSSRNATRFLRDPEARRRFDIVRQCIKTGISTPAFGELWLAAELDMGMGDILELDLGTFDAADGDLLDFPLD